jgi:hypothetical protein
MICLLTSEWHIPCSAPFNATVLLVNITKRQTAQHWMENASLSLCLHYTYFQTNFICCCLCWNILEKLKYFHNQPIIIKNNICIRHSEWKRKALTCSTLACCMYKLSLHCCKLHNKSETQDWSNITSLWLYYTHVYCSALKDWAMAYSGSKLTIFWTISVYYTFILPD